MTKQESLQLFSERKVRSVFDDEQEKWFFSIVDVVAVLTESADPKQYIKRIKARDPELNLNWGTICTLLRLTSADGKKRQEMTADVQGMFRIIQSIPSPKAEPFKQWMAQLASTRLDQMQDPELSKQKNPRGFKANQKIAKEGGSVAKAARIQLEDRLGHSVISSAKASDYLLKEKK